MSVFETHNDSSVTISAPLTESGNLAIDFGDNHHIDAFGRLRVSNPETLFNSDMVYDGQTLFWEGSTATGASITHNSSESCVELALSTASGSRAVRQTRQYFRYQPGKSQLVVGTFKFSTGQAGTRQRIGYFDDSSDGGFGDGIYLELDGTTTNIVRRSSTGIAGAGTETVAQSAWNLDVFDGNGQSGVTIDWTKSQILTIDMQWLGVGRVRVGFDIDGQLHGAHEFLNANKYDGVYMKSATLPFRYEIENTSTVAAAPTLNQICTTVESEGGASIDQALTFTAGNGATKVALSSVWTPIASIRPAPTLNGITNRARAVITGFDVISDTASQFALFYNTTLSSGTSWTSVNSSHSAVQLDVASGSAAGGILFDSAYVPGAGGNRTVSISNPTVTEYPFTLNIAGDTGSGTPITLQGRTFAGNNSAAVMFTWIEEY